MPEPGKETGIKLLVTSVIVLGVATLSYGAYSIYGSIYSPFKLSPPARVDISALRPKTADEEIAALKIKDSDKDTLSDYDEINLYNTSPYIADTDSDGSTDDTEVTVGTDPTCAPGDDCRGIRLVTPSTKISDLFPQFSDSSVTLKDKTLGEFRDILIEQGYDKDKLAELSDDALLILLEESLKLQDEEAASEDVESSGGPTLDYDDVRKLLIEMGVPEDEVYSLSNSEVAEILRTFN